MILRKRRAQKFYNKFYEILDGHYLVNKSEKHIVLNFILYGGQSNKDENWVGDNPLQELYDDDELRKEVEKLFIADGWKSLKVTRTPEKISNFDDAVKFSISRFNVTHYLVLDQ